MALRLGLLYLCMCMCLLLAVASAGPRPRPSPPAAVPGADSCYKTVTGVPEWCAKEFIRALFGGNNNPPISDECCVLLACVREGPCATVLRGFCLPPEADQCPPPPPPPPPSLRSLPPSISPAASTATVN